MKKVRLKWVQDRCLDSIIEVHTQVKAASLLKDAILRSSTGFLTSKSLNNSEKLLGLTFPTLRFIRRYPTLFQEFPHPNYPSLPSFRLTDLAKTLHHQENRLLLDSEPNIVERLCRLLMITNTKMLPLHSLHPLKWDLGLPHDFDRNFVNKYPDHFQIVKGTDGLYNLKLVQWREEYAVSTLQRIHEKRVIGATENADACSYRDFKRGRKAALEFPMSFPRGYGERNKVIAWMNHFHKLPYISPYEDSKDIDPNSDLMEKRVVGVLHEFLSLTIHNKAKKEYITSLTEELSLPAKKLTRIFSRYPGIFYVSLKCRANTVALREGYHRGTLVDPHPLVCHRDKFHCVMRTGLINQGKAAEFLPHLDNLLDNERNDDGVEHSEEEEFEVADDSCSSDVEISSDEG